MARSIARSLCDGCADCW